MHLVTVLRLRDTGSNLRLPGKEAQRKLRHIYRPGRFCAGHYPYTTTPPFTPPHHVVRGSAGWGTWGCVGVGVLGQCPAGKCPELYVPQRRKPLRGSPTLKLNVGCEMVAGIHEGGRKRVRRMYTSCPPTTIPCSKSKRAWAQTKITTRIGEKLVALALSPALRALCN